MRHVTHHGHDPVVVRERPHPLIEVDRYDPRAASPEPADHGGPHPAPGSGHDGHECVQISSRGSRHVDILVVEGW
jgi:hypothetical protein